LTTDVFTPEQRSAVMRRVKGRDTTPELKVRDALRRAGIGYRLGGGGLPGRPDVVMKGRRVALLVHGCFWHGHACARGARQPKANAATGPPRSTATAPGTPSTRRRWSRRAGG
jgi:DNA mismatch endonuclease (patch repair protein)